MKIRFMALIMALAIPLCFTGCLKSGTDEGKDSQAEISGQSGAEENDLEYPVSVAGAELDSRPGIAVSLSPALTEKIMELGLGDRLEGVSDYCQDVGARIPCGTAQAPNLDEIKALSPHLLITETALSADDMDALGEMRVTVAVIPHADSLDALLENYKALAVLFDGNKSGAALGDAFNKKFRAQVLELSESALSEPKNAVYLRLLDFTVATGDTLENELMEIAGFNNIAKQYTGWTYPENDAMSEAGKANFASLDFIFCDRRSVTMKMMENSAYYKVLNAVRKDFYLYIDMTVFERQTLRMFDELQRMQQYAKGEIEGGAMQEQQ